MTSSSAPAIASAIRARDAALARRLIEQDINWGTKVFRDMAANTTPR